MIIKVCITGWRRSDYFEEVVKSLSQCNGFDEFNTNGNIIVSIDYHSPKNTEDHLNIVKKYGLRAVFFNHQDRLGCAGNVGFAFKKAFEDSSTDAVIMLEDDTVPSRDFLSYMSAMLSRYKNDKTILNVSAYHRRVHKLKKTQSDHRVSEGKGDPNTVFKRDWFTTWAWATWRRIHDEIGEQWFGIHWNQFEQKTGSSCPRGKDFLKYVYMDDTGSWGWPMNMYWRKDRFEIAPDVSRAQNIGARDGMFVPGAEWHRNNHYVEIWMGNSEYDTSTSYDYEEILTEKALQ